MELDVTALDMIPAVEEERLYPCSITCEGITCKGRTCRITTT
ncbi:ALQxL family class IV lanthipeptide [Nonomuraea sp. NPDC050790]